jgi:hypothetical protein
MDLVEKIILGCIAGVVLSALVAIPIAAKNHDEWVENCRKAGGEPFAPRNGRVCLDPKSVIQVR